MKDSSRPWADDLIVVAEVIVQWSNKPSLAFFVDQSGLIILNNFSTESWMVNIGDLLKHLFAVGSHFLVNDASIVDVILGELFDAPELHMLVHKLGYELTIL